MHFSCECCPDLMKGHYSLIFKFLYKQLDLCFKKGTVETPFTDKKCHKADKSVQAMFSAVQHLWDGHSHLYLASPKGRLHHLVEYEPVILPFLGNTGMWINHKYAEAMIQSHAWCVAQNSVDRCLKILEKLDPSLTGTCTLSLVLSGFAHAWLRKQHDQGLQG
jgi:hypothetical protein